MRYYNVFHISQVEGVEPLTKDELKDIEPIEAAENILRDYITRENITLKHAAGDKAYYSPNRDMIRLPLMEQFRDVSEYYSTAFHEATHSTMKESRCNRMEDRKGILVAFGSNEYSKEELIAKIGSANIVNILGIETNFRLYSSKTFTSTFSLALLR